VICITQVSKLFYCALWCHHSYLRCWTVCDMPSDPPHLLELNTNLVKGLCDDSNKDILHKPCKEKYHGAKIEGCPPAREAVNGSVHDEHPAFLWGCLIYCENASGCKTKQTSTKLCHKTRYTWCTRFTPYCIYGFMYYRMDLFTVFTNLPY